MWWKDSTPYTKEFFATLSDFISAQTECRKILYSPPDVMSYALWEAVFLSRLPYPDPQPEVPEPEQEIFVTTGGKLPCSGIWEPVNGDYRIGTMHYLHGGANAPKLNQTLLDPSDKEWGYDHVKIGVVWRLIWRDDRYEDGSIPEEEKEYKFMCPVPEGVEDPYENYPSTYTPLKYIKKHSLRHPLLDRK
jgi:hypothetical protein